MYRARLLRSTPFRLALSFGLFFIVALLVAGTIAYGLMERELARAIDRSVGDTYSVVASTYSSNDLEDLIAAVDTYSALKSAGDQAFLLLNRRGERLAGNIRTAQIKPGLSTMAAADLGLSGEDPIRVMAGSVDGNLLFVGQSYRETDAIEHIVLASFLWASGLIVAVAIVGGALLARRATRRLESIERTMIKVSGGNLACRIPVRGNGDDIDVVSTHMNQALGRLSGLVESMRQVSADIAHDLKTPLNRLRMTIEQALQQQGQTETVESLLLDAREECDRIDATFGALLRISQIEAGAGKGRFKPLDLREAMSSVAEIYEHVAEDNAQKLELNLQAPAPAAIQGDHELLTQLFVNLIENAITHCPAGTKMVMTLAATEQSYLACISDNGPGIPEQERELVFRRLYRLDKSRTTPGNGLGLSLVKAIADLHSAAITLEDGGPGLRICLSFPKTGNQ
ncbi:ATP-binding protein [Rhizobium sp. BR 314]|uniref:HAMP domain-containing sensor histidine kinase n=1 Tax=Rhizobium sp. BR 314 TaxID=3040013 RepID=UPI0039BF1629